MKMIIKFLRSLIVPRGTFVNRRRIEDKELLEIFAVDETDPMFLGLCELVERNLEEARTLCEDIEVATVPQQLSFYAGGATAMREIRDYLIDIRARACAMKGETAEATVEEDVKNHEDV